VPNACTPWRLFMPRERARTRLAMAATAVHRTRAMRSWSLVALLVAGLVLGCSRRDPNPVVWVNTQSGIYHCQGSQYYRSTGAGELMTEKDAQAAGHRAAGGRDCR
jgi:hypothetical protein